MDVLDASRSIFKDFRSDPYAGEIFGALSGTFIFVSIFCFSIEYATALHWSLALLLTAGVAALALWTGWLTVSVESLTMFLVFFVFSVLLAGTASAGISYLLYIQGWASYDTPSDVTVETFLKHYLWIFFDMLPAVDMWKTIPLKSPIEPADAVSGVPTLAFKLFILIFTFEAIRRRWKRHAADEGAVQ